MPTLFENGDHLARLIPHRRAGADPANNPPAAALILGCRLKALRESLGLTQTAAVRNTGFSNSTLSRLERGESPPEEIDVRALARRYNMVAHEEAQLMQLAAQARRPVWWSRYLEPTAGYLTTFIGLEEAARRIDTYEALVVPGVLQTEAYARDMIERHFLSSEQDKVELAVGLRMERKRRFLDSPPELASILISEFVLQPLVEDKSVMAGQMLHLHAMALTPGIKLRVVPMARIIGLQMASITHLEFDAGGPPPMIYLEGYESADYRPKATGVAGGRNNGADYERHLQLLVKMKARAATRFQSMRLIESAVERYS
ncbi:helix-turn-helix domain-containing protein [Kitasatospora sp. NPDC094011]|uniref:helix-turn-helix domain-containing protein n=1 Tax=Kitasatospora sp. NPDC094011 TaxID=3364090 RepID=UPI0037F652F5